MRPRREPYHRGRWRLQRERLQLPDDPPPTPERDPRALAEGIAAVLRTHLPRGTAELQALTAEWTALVGSDLARHTRPGALDRGCLTIYVDGSAWLSELQRFAQKRLLTAVQKRFGPAVIRQLRLRLDPDGPAPRP